MKKTIKYARLNPIYWFTSSDGVQHKTRLNDFQAVTNCAK